jgi:hypothetical protein
MGRFDGPTNQGTLIMKNINSNTSSTGLSSQFIIHPNGNVFHLSEALDLINTVMEGLHESYDKLEKRNSFALKDTCPNYWETLTKGEHTEITS